MGRTKQTARRSTAGKGGKRTEVPVELAENAPDADEEEVPAASGSSSASSSSSSSSSSSTSSSSNSTSTPSRLTRSESSVIRSFGKATMATPTDVCFTFDTTGSMYASLTTVRATIEKTAKNLVESLPQLRIAIIAHGDYTDDLATYTTKILDFSRDVKEIVKFVHDVPATGGGDAPEAYEKALYDANRLSWNPKATKALVMFGDDVPHPPSYTTEKYSWRSEVDGLIKKDCKIYGIFCGSNSENKMFYEEMADVTGGVFVELTEFSVVDKMFMAICYREVSHEALAAYEKEIKTEDAGVRRMFRNLSDQNLTKKTDTGRVVGSAWWDDETDQKLNKGAVASFKLDTSRDPPKFVGNNTFDFTSSGASTSSKTYKGSVKKGRGSAVKKARASSSGDADDSSSSTTTPKKGKKKTTKKKTTSKKPVKKSSKKTAKKTSSKKTTPSKKKVSSTKAVTTKKRRSSRKHKDSDAEYEDEGDEDDEEGEDEEVEEEEEEEAPKKKTTKKKTTKKKTTKKTTKKKTKKPSKKKSPTAKERSEERRRRRYRPYDKKDWEHALSTPEKPEWATWSTRHSRYFERAKVKSTK